MKKQAPDTGQDFLSLLFGPIKKAAGEDTGRFVLRRSTILFLARSAGYTHGAANWRRATGENTRDEKGYIGYIY